jgi:uncharacterized protein YecE (DUF72 family)
MPDIRIGISGWVYPPWRGEFYPKGLKQKLELEYASRQLNSIEINGTFYSLQKPRSFQNWYDRTPAGFVFSVKGPQYITHIRRLKDVRAPLASFLASGLFCLKEKLGPILWQFPPNLKFDPERFETFFEMLPHSTKKAAVLARESDLSRDRVWTKTDSDHPLRHSAEIRHESFATPLFIKLLRKYNIAAVIADTAGKWPCIEDVTSDFIYIRLHGDEQIYVSGYTEKGLDRWADRIKRWSAGGQPKDAKRIAPDLSPRKRSSRDVFVYFDNDLKVKSPRDAKLLARKLDLKYGDETI